MNRLIINFFISIMLIVSSVSYADNNGGDFKNNGDGTITDLKSGLMWKICSEGQEWNGVECDGVPFNTINTSTDEIKYEYAGYYNWRIPTAYELEAIVVCVHPKSKEEDYRDQYLGCNSDYKVPTIFSHIFPNTRPVKYWSSTISSLGYAESVSFRTGAKYIDRLSDRYSVRLVRAP